MFRWLGLRMLRLVAIMLMASLAGAVLLRVAPGFSTDQQQLNAGLSSQSIAAIRQARLADADVAHYYFKFLSALVRGDLGASHELNQPVSQLLRERLPVTLRSLAIALLVAWVAGLGLALASQLVNSRVFVFFADGLSGTFIATPAAVLALIMVLLRMPPELAAALLVFPKIYRYAQNLLQNGYEMPHVLTARARGACAWRVLAWHVAPSALPQLLALLGVSVSIALGVLLPIEVICDVPGIGQLAWQAAESRDLNLLVNLTLVVTLATVCATTFSDIARRTLTRSAS